jgi:DNA-nicking Smr family endonuclease
LPIKRGAGQRERQRQPKPEPAADASFREAVRDVKPLRHSAATTRSPAARIAPPPKSGARAGALRTDPPRAAAPRTGAAAAAARAAAARAAAMAPPAEPLLTAATVTAEEALSFRRAGVREQTLRRLRRGTFPIDAEIDLHGQIQSRARDDLAEFLGRCRDAGHRCVRVIHGKGYRSGARGPILKSAVNDWLRRNLDVMAFTSARPIDGGTGAVYVLLRA